MWELTLSLNKEKAYLLNFIYLKLAEQVKFAGGVIVKVSALGREKLTLAVPTKQKDYFVLLILELLSEVIAIDYKSDFIEQNLNSFQSNNLNKLAFSYALTIFDKQTDKDLIKKNLILDKELNIDRFYDFKLNELKSRWRDICLLVDDNALKLKTSGSQDDLTKFLINSSEVNSIEVHIYKNDKGFKFLDAENKPIVYFASTATSEQQALKELITLSPAKIVLHSTSNCELFKFIDELYGQKVSVCEANELS